MYILDTNICIFLMKNKSESLVKKITSINPNEICISSVTLAELEYGIAKSQSKEKNKLTLLAFFSYFNQILDFSPKHAEVFGKVRAYLEKAGKIIGPYDLQIASQGLAEEMTVVTNNTREFNRVPGLKVEDWTI